MKETKIYKPLNEKNEYAYMVFADWCNKNGYIIKDDNPNYYYCEKYNVDQKEKNQQRISELKNLLISQDYKTIKYIQGELSEEEFNEVKLQCKAWRDEINRLNQIV